MFAPDYPIETERLRLRQYGPDDFDALLAIESRADVNRYLYSEPRGADEVRTIARPQDGRAALIATRATRSP